MGLRAHACPTARAARGEPAGDLEAVAQGVAGVEALGVAVAGHAGLDLAAEVEELEAREGREGVDDANGEGIASEQFDEAHLRTS